MPEWNIVMTVSIVVGLKTISVFGFKLLTPNISILNKIRFVKFSFLFFYLETSKSEETDRTF